MTSPNSDHIEFEKKIPILSPEVEEKTKNGVYCIELPTEHSSVLSIKNHVLSPIIQLKCHSIYLRNGDKVHCCNSLVKTIVDKGSGDQTEIIECAKCRTSYLVRQRYIDGKLDLKIAVWDISRNIKRCSFQQHDKDGNYLVKFNTTQ